MAVLESQAESDQKDSWLGKRAAKAAKKDRLKMSERGGELFGVVVLGLLTSFFVYHQITQTGFFTSSFGLLGMILFYAPVPIAIFANLVRAISGRRNVARPVEMVNAIVWSIAAYWFFTVFPFDFSHLGDALPLSLRFLVSWIPNWIPRIIILLVGIVGVGQAIYTPILYLSTPRELEKNASAY